MKNECSCYHVQKKWVYNYHPITGQPMSHDIEVGVCWGTKEVDECNCGGDKTKCDFYPEVRAESRKNSAIKDAISYFKYGISHDIFQEPVITHAKLAVKALEKQLKESVF